MSDNIAIDWNASPSNAFMDGFNNSQKMQDITQSRQARAAVLANPGDANALARYAIYDPQGANAFQGQLDQQRAAQTRSAVADGYRAYAPQQNAMSPAPVPQAVPPAPPAAPAIGTPPVTAMPGATAPQPQQAPQGALGGVAQPTQPQVQPPAGPLNDASHPVSVQIGQAAVQGQTTPYDALARIAQTDPEAASQLVTNVNNMDVVQRQRAAESTDYLGRSAYSLLQMPQAQRAAALQQMAPSLAQHGIQPAQIQQAIQSGLSDDMLHGIVGQAMSVQGAIEQSNKVIDQRQAGQRIGIDQQNSDTSRMGIIEQARHDKVDEARGIQVEPGKPIINPTTGQVIYNPNAGGGDINDRIIQVEGTGRNPTSSASGPGQFVNSTFRQMIGQASPDVARQIAGMNDAQLTAYRASHASELTPIQQQMTRQLTGYNQATLANAGVPTTDGNTYMAHVFGAGGTANAVNAGADAPAAKYVGGMKALTNNGLPANATVGQVQAWATNRIESASGGGGNIISSQAQAIARGDQAPLTGRAAVTGLGAQIMQKVYELNPQYDSKVYKGQAGAVTQFMSGKNADNVRSQSVAIDHMDTLRQAAVALGNGNYPMLNHIAQSFAASTGSAAPTNFDALKGVVSTEVAKAVGAGHLTDKSIGDVQAGITHSSSVPQLLGYMDKISQLQGGQISGLARQYQQTTGKGDFARFLSPAAQHLLTMHGGQVASAGKPTVSNW